MVAPAIEVVKLGGSTLSSGRQIVTDEMVAEEWNTLRKRVEWVIANRQEDVSSVRGWCLAAHKSGGVLSSAMTREQDNVLMDADTAEALAAVVHVDAVWLRTGKGVPDNTRSALARFDTHSMRRWAADMLVRLNGVDPQRAWWLMRDIELEVPTKEDFLEAGTKLLKEQDPAPAEPELTEEKVAGFTEKFARRMKRQQS